MNGFLRDLRYGLRGLLRRPAFTLIAVVTLALGIGANTAIYSVMHAAFFARYPIANPDELFHLYGEDKGRNLQQLNLSVPKFQFMRDQQTVFSGIGAANYNGFTLIGNGEPVQINGAFVTANFLQTFGASPIVGRFFEPQEEETPTVAVISETMWRERFGAAQSIIGQGLNLSGVSYTIVGVAPKLPPTWQADVWVTRPFQPPGIDRELLQRGVSFLSVIARLKTDTSVERAQQELAVITQRYRADNAEKADSTWNLIQVPMRADIIGTSRSPLFILISAVALVLLLACANVANLLLVRFAGRRREIALRLAIGASRWRVVRQFWIESVIVSLVAALIGVVLAITCMPALIRLAENFVTFSSDIKINVPVLAITLGLALLTGLLMGAYPAVQASRCAVAKVLHEGGRSLMGSPGQRHVRNLLVGVQVAVSLVLLVGAALLIISFLQLQKQAPGFRAEGVFTANLTLPTTRYPDIAAQGRFYLKLTEELRHAPGVVNASLVQGLPLSGANSRSPYARADGDVAPLKDRPLGLTRSITPGYFDTLSIPLLAGRDFTERDTNDAPLVVIVTQSTARKLFPNENPLGRRIFMGSQNSTGLVMEIAGVVGDVRSQTLENIAEVEFYRPVMQRQSPFMQLAVRTQSDPAGFLTTARQALNRIDAEMPLNNPLTLETIVAQSLAQQRLLFTLLGLFAALALVLASVGIYSVVAYMVSQRTAEIGLRMALGAQRRDVFRLIVGQGMTPVAIGIAVGLVGCLALGGMVQQQLYGVSALNPLLLVATGTGLAVVAGFACWLPALRATRVDPLVALRYE